MKPRTSFAWVLLLAASAAASAGDAPTYHAAMAAYTDGDFATCAAILTGPLTGPKADEATVAYNAACCLARSGKPAEAFAQLDRAIAADLIEVGTIRGDADLASLHASPQWQTFMERATREMARHEAGMDLALRTELIARRDRDQAGRGKIGQGQPTPELRAEVGAIDADNTAWMKTVIAAHGWPGKSLVGKTGATAAWLLVQHADRDPAFQASVLPLLQAAVAAGEAEGKDLAYLTDRVLVAAGKPQRYGTQYDMVDGRLQPVEIEDRAHVDARRAEVNLGTLAEYDAMIRANTGK